MTCFFDAFLLYLVRAAMANTAEPCLPPALRSNGQNHNINVTLMEKGWATHKLVTAALGIVLRDAAGFQVEIIPRYSNGFLDTINDFTTGACDIEAEAWSVNPGSPRYEQYLSKGSKVEWLGTVGYGGRSGLYTFDFTVAAHTLSDYYKFFKADIDGVTQEWPEFVRFGDVDMTGQSNCLQAWCNGSAYIPPLCQNNPSDCPVIFHPTSEYDSAFFEALTLNHGLKLTTLFVGWGWDGDGGQIQSLYEQRRNVLWYHWTPDLIHTKVNSARVEFPSNHMGCAGHIGDIPSPLVCDYPEDSLSKLVARSLRSTKPEAYAVAQGFQVSEAGLALMLQEYGDNGGDETKAACSWALQLSEAQLDKIVPKCVRAAPLEPRPGDMVFDSQSLSCQEQLGQVNCTNGTVYLSSFNQCVCAAGQFQDGDSCTKCDSGSFSGTPGMRSCDLCLPGHFSAQEGASACTRCRVGTFTPQFGQAICEACPLAGSVTQVVGAESADECKCKEGLFHDGKLCSQCPEGMVCPFGSDSNPGSAVLPLLRASYWSTSSDRLSVYACDSDERCPGGEPETCQDKLKGQACAHCEEGFAWSGKECMTCSSVETSKVLFPVLPLLLLPVVILILYNFFGDKYDRWNSWQNGYASMAFIALNHYQIISLARAANIQFPIDIARTWDALMFTSDISSIFQSACAGFSDFKSSLIINFVTPIIVTLVFLSVFASSWGFAHLLRQPVLAMRRDRTLNVFFGLIFTFFTGIAAMAFTIFKCSSNPNDKKTLTIDRSITCYESDWNGMLVVGLLSVFFWCLGFGCIFVYIVCVAPYSFADEMFQMRWKFLFIKFRPDVYWFALVIIAKGILMNFGFLFLTSGIAQMYWLLVLITLYLLFTIAFRPWRHMAINGFDTHAHLCLILVLAALSWFAKTDAQEAAGLDRDMSNMVIAFTFLLIPAAIPVGWHMVYSRVSPLYQYQLKRSIVVMHNVIKQLALHKDFEDWMLSLNEWDFWFMKQATSIVSTELLGLKFGSTKCTSRQLSKHGLEDEQPPVLVIKDDAKDGAMSNTEETFSGASNHTDEIEMLEAVNEILQAAECQPRGTSSFTWLLAGMRR